MKITAEITAHYRLNTSDYNVLDEVIFRRIYRRSRINFDVEHGERWLDLGANIGAFMIYCVLRGATADCYEPDPENCRLLQKNLLPGCSATHAAITASKEETLPFWKGRANGNHSKYTAIPTDTLAKHGDLPNVYAGDLMTAEYDGIKMDIEGSEGPLIDQWLIPSCKKLVLEYHTSRDKSVRYLAERLERLKQHFKVVQYPPEYDRIIERGSNPSYNSNQLTFFDRMIFCKEPR